jgi:hypothetical protein
MTYGFHPEARLEYLEAIDFYESRRTGLGAVFTREVEATIQRDFRRADSLEGHRAGRAPLPYPHISFRNSLHHGKRLSSDRRRCAW